MQRREKLLLLALVVAVVIGTAAPLVRAVFIDPIETRESSLSALQDTVDSLELTERRIMNASKEVAQLRGRSLPQDPLNAQRLYLDWLTDQAQTAGLIEIKSTASRRPPTGDLFTAVQVTLEGKANVEQLRTFIYNFYRADLLHRIQSIAVSFEQQNQEHPYTMTMTAEGLVLADAPVAHSLFPSAELAEDIDGEAQTITVNGDAKNFPAEGEFRVRIGKEFLTVTARADQKWTVTRGVDSTNREPHKATDAVDLAAVHPEMKDITLEEYKFLVAENPFIKPNISEDPGRAIAQATCLVSFFSQGTDRRIVLRNSQNNQLTVLREGEELRAGDVLAKVESIERDKVVLKRDDKTWNLKPGMNLGELEGAGGNATVGSGDGRSRPDSGSGRGGRRGSRGRFGREMKPENIEELRKRFTPEQLEEMRKRFSERSGGEMRSPGSDNNSQPQPQSDSNASEQPATAAETPTSDVEIQAEPAESASESPASP